MLLISSILNSSVTAINYLGVRARLNIGGIRFCGKDGVKPRIKGRFACRNGIFVVYFVYL